MVCGFLMFCFMNRIYRKQVSFIASHLLSIVIKLVFSELPILKVSFFVFIVVFCQLLIYNHRYTEVTSCQKMNIKLFFQIICGII